MSSCFTPQGEAVDANQNWYRFDSTRAQISTDLITYEYRLGKYGMAIQDFVHLTNQNDYSYSFDAIGTGYARYDSTSVQFVSVTTGRDEAALEVLSGKTRKIERIRRHSPVLEIEYLEMGALWIEDKIEVPGNADDLVFVLRGMRDVEGFAEGRRLWKAAEEKCGHNFGDCFIQANGSEPADCEYKGYFIYGLLNRRTGEGIGFVYPTALTVHDWKVWWDEPGKVAIEFFPSGRTGTRWIYPITRGKEDLFEKGIEIIDTYGNHSEAHTGI